MTFYDKTPPKRGVCTKKLLADMCFSLRSLIGDFPLAKACLGQSGNMSLLRIDNSKRAVAVRVQDRRQVSQVKLIVEQRQLRAAEDNRVNWLHSQDTLNHTQVPLLGTFSDFTMAELTKDTVVQYARIKAAGGIHG